MIVSQADYERWQNMTAARNGSQTQSTESSTDAGMGALNASSSRQNPAVAVPSDAQESTNLAAEEQPKSFLEEAFERLTLARLGIDQEKMDELKEEIEKTETAIEALSEQKPHTPAQKEELNVLKDKLEQLKEALEELVKEANERANKDDTIGQRNTDRSLKHYQSISSIV